MTRVIKLKTFEAQDDYGLARPTLHGPQHEPEIIAAWLKSGTSVDAGAQKILSLETLLASRPSTKADNQVMTDITRGEMTAHFDAADARRDALRAKDNADWEIRQAKSDAVRDANMARFEERIDLSIAKMDSNTIRIEGAVDALKGDIKSFRFQMLSSLAGAVTAVLIGIWALNTAVLGNMVASFESGKNTALAVGETTKRLEALQDRIEAEQKTRKALIQPVAPVSGPAAPTPAPK